jgi:hypothetical protein
LLILLGLAATAAAGLRATHAQEAETAAEPDTVVDSASQDAQPDSPTAPERAATTTTTPIPETSPPPQTFVSPYHSGDTQRGPFAEALFQVSRTPPSLANSESEPVSDQGWEVLCKTQVAKLKSYYVLQVAVGKANIADLPMIRQQQEPVAWLAKNLDVGFHPGSEMMYVRLFGKPGQEDQLKKIVDAVADAYKEEAVYAERQRELTKRDLLAELLKKLNEEFTEKTQTYYDMARELGTSATGSGQVAQELDMRRLDRVENEIMRLEGALLELETSGQPGNKKFYTLRIQQLNKQRAEIVESIESRSQSSTDLMHRFRDLERMQRVVDEMSMKLGVMDLDANAPDRIQQVQPAIVIGGEKPAATNPAK